MDDDLSLPDIQAFLDNVQDPTNKGRTGQGNQLLQQGTVTAIDLATYKVTVQINGKDVIGLRTFEWPLAIGDVVWCIQEGRVKIILGKVFAGSSSFWRGAFASSQSIAADAWVKVQLNNNQGNAALFNDATDTYTIPKAGLYHVEGFVRWVNGIPDGHDACLSLVVNGGTNSGYTSSWQRTANAGRFSQHYSMLQYFVKGDQLQFFVYLEGASSQLANGLFAVAAIQE